MTGSVCIIQARRQSTRLPDKILLPLGGKPVLQHVIERCQRIPGVDNVIVAAPEGAFEDPVETLAREAGALTFRGDMHDVLSRYWGAAQMVARDYVMRVTADCPLIDPDVCGNLLKTLQHEGAEYGGLGGWPHGLDCEVFTYDLLDRAHRLADKPVDREHVTLWMKGQDDVRKVFLKPEAGRFFSGNRWVVDYPEDYAFMQALFALLPDGGEFLPFEDVLALIETAPEVREINRLREDDWAAATKQLYAESGQAWDKPA